MVGFLSSAGESHDYQITRLFSDLHSPFRSAAQDDLSDQLEVEGDPKADWEAVEDERNMETVNRLAEKYNQRAGKWLLHIYSEWVDKVSRRI